jgi:hypothetical protein
MKPKRRGRASSVRSTAPPWAARKARSLADRAGEAPGARAAASSSGDTRRQTPAAMASSAGYSMVQVSGAHDHRFAQREGLDDVVCALGREAAADHRDVGHGEVGVHLAEAVAEKDVGRGRDRRGRMPRRARAAALHPRPVAARRAAVSSKRSGARGT